MAEKTEPIVPVKKFGALLTGWLVLAIVANIILALLTLSTAAQVAPRDQGWVYLSGALNVAGAVCAIAIFRWKRWGAYGYGACLGITAFLNLLAGDVGSVLRGLLLMLLVIGLIKPHWAQFE
ncbi:MAG: hypothetical protein KIS88_01500 [Anaerolineales bacterium]|nr:hypothetical protein [Anaerolineales bacterium]